MHRSYEEPQAWSCVSPRLYVRYNLNMSTRELDIVAQLLCDQEGFPISIAVIRLRFSSFCLPRALNHCPGVIIFVVRVDREAFSRGERIMVVLCR